MQEHRPSRFSSNLYQIYVALALFQLLQNVINESYNVTEKC